jgi:hypothetical protein
VRLGLLLLVVALGLAGCSSGAADVLDKRAAASPTAAPAGASAGSAAAGNQKVSGNVAVTLNGFQFLERGTYIQPKEGMAFLAVDLTVRNQGQEEVTVGSRALTLKDAGGAEYRRNLTGGSKPSPASTLAAGQSSSGEISFEVPVTATAFQLVLTGGEGAPPAVWEIKR